MAPSVKEPEQQNSAAPVASAPQPKVQPVALEISVSVNGVRTVEGSDKREPFSETTQTVLVFGTGAVIRLNSGVAPGQLLFLTNEKTKKEVVCQVVKSKNYRSASGYVELEFTEPAIGFWGMRFPTDRITSAPAITSTPAKPAFSSAPAETKPIPPANQVKPTVLPTPAAVIPVPNVVAAPPAPVAAAPVNAAPAVPEPTAPIAPPVVDPATEELKRQTARLQEQLSSMHFEEAPASVPPPAPERPVMQFDAIAMSDATVQIFEMARPETNGGTGKPGPSVVAPANTAQPLEAPAKPKIEKTAGGLHEEEVKIPAWLEPLARNAATPSPATAPVPLIVPAAPATQVSFPVVQNIAAPETQPAASAKVVSLPLTIAAANPPESEEAQVAGESYDFGGKHAVEPVAAESELQAPKFDSNLFGSSEETVVEEQAGGGSKKGLVIGLIAATVLLAAGGGWWYMQQNGHAAASSGAPIVSQGNQQTSTQAATQQNFQASTPQQSQGAKAFSNPAPVNSQPANSVTQSLTPATEVQKVGNSRDGLKPAPVSSATRAAEPVVKPAEEEKKSTFKDLRLAAPTVKGGQTADGSNDAEPGLAMDNSAVPAAGNLGMASGNGPKVPVPVGGDVISAQLVSSVPPVYPQLAKTQRLSGDVKIDALIDENGRVTGMKIVSGPVMLHQAAMDALKQWKYRPATLNGSPVSMHLLVTIRFQLK